VGQRDVELILARHLASYLATPIILVDAAGALLYYNEPAEPILGLRFAETGEFRVTEWPIAFTATDEGGEPIAATELPLIVALRERRPMHRRMWIKGLDGVRRHIEATALPLIGQADRHLGAIALFWEVAD
jgi:PAS domain-containing protein